MHSNPLATACRSTIRAIPARVAGAPPEKKSQRAMGRVVKASKVSKVGKLSKVSEVGKVGKVGEQGEQGT